MIFKVGTLFPEICEVYVNKSIIGRAKEKGHIEIKCYNIRDYTEDKHKRVDDYPFGGGKGMLIQAEPVYKCYLGMMEDSVDKMPYVINMSPRGKKLTQEYCKELSKKREIFIICGHYEGIDQRVIDKIVDQEVSIGDYVMTGGELGALVLIDSISRLCNGVLSERVCFEDESHYNGLLEYNQYTRPRNWRGVEVPEVLISGHFKNIEEYKKENSIDQTKEKRLDLYNEYILNKDTNNQ